MTIKNRVTILLMKQNLLGAKSGSGDRLSEEMARVLCDILGN